MKKAVRKKQLSSKMAPNSPQAQKPRSYISTRPLAKILIGKIIEYGPLVLLSQLLLLISPLVYYGAAGEFENVPKMAFLQWGIIILAFLRLLVPLPRGTFKTWAWTSS